MFEHYNWLVQYKYVLAKTCDIVNQRGYVNKPSLNEY